jgi:hypothetical protein
MHRTKPPQKIVESLQSEKSDSYWFLIGKKCSKRSLTKKRFEQKSPKTLIVNMNIGSEKSYFVL